jgi:TIM-barrel protein
MKLVFPNRLALSAMAGICNAEFASKHPVGFAVLGGFNADRTAMKAAIEAVQRGRKEFIFKDPIDGIEEELKKLREMQFPGVVGVNTRSATLEGYTKVAELCRDYGAVIEINAHCRQPEFLSIGCGQELLFKAERLAEIVSACSKICPVSVKIRGGLGIDYISLAKLLKDSGACIIHVDAMIPGGGNDLQLVRKLSAIMFTVGNNSVVDYGSAVRMAEVSHLVSAARAVLKNENFFHSVLKGELARSVELVLE